MASWKGHSGTETINSLFDRFSLSNSGSTLNLMNTLLTTEDEEEYPKAIKKLEKTAEKNKGVRKDVDDETNEDFDCRVQQTWVGQKRVMEIT